ncbi:Fc receptor-like protein 5 isoform X3 [Salarias fasciatus]|uniref:Fc receptor-like protein 5 isoform X3 n=1 Tax=Salarias fasciatus TaxID=181472 RepID=UPI001176C27D|nr:Fc receptor-like protein 5 isoform X3 [Salarias fasciatus]
MGGRLFTDLWFFLFCVLLCRSCAAGAVLKIDPGWSTLFIGEFVTLTCDIEGAEAGWEYSFYKDQQQYSPGYQTTNSYRFQITSSNDGGEYDCVGRHKGSSETEKSKTVSFTAAEKPRATLTSGNTTISVGGSVILSCSVRDSDGWRYEFYRRTSSTSSETRVETNVGDNGVIQVSKGGKYQCRGERETSGYLSDMSDEVIIWITFTNKPVITRQPSWSQIFQGEKITLTCEVQGGEKTDWRYYWRRNSRSLPNEDEKLLQFTASESLSGEYECMARRRDDSYSSTTWIEAFTVSVLQKPRATLTSGTTTISVGGSVSLSCSVRDSDGWKYEFYRRTLSTSWEKLVETNVGDNGVIQVSKGGIYRCRGERETSGYVSDMSDEATIRITFTNKPVITRQPSWSQIFQGEKITLTCEVQGGEKTDWRYYWRRNSRSLPEDEKLLQFTASESLNGEYGCMARRRDDFYSSTTWSEAFTVSVLRSAPSSTQGLKLVLSVSPSWLIPGASVTLICHTEPPSAGWSFYWFKAVPNSQDSYTYEPLPGTSSGTANNSFTVHGQTHTAGYACSAGRGDPLIYTQYSRPTFVWSSGVHPSASLTVNPDRVQHFTSESLSLTCEGSSSQWRLIRFLTDDSLLSFLLPATINGSTYIKNEAPRKAVYWCESGTEFSNAVNISTHSDGVILVSPVYPVPVGESVTLLCVMKTGNIPSDVFFYKNNKLIENERRGEMKISAVSESDEGFYKCQYNGRESAQSWMAVKVSRSESSSFHVWLIFGLVCGVLLIFILCLLWCYKCKKRSCWSRRIESLYVNQSSATNQPVTQSESQLYSSLLHGDVSLYESLRRPGNPANGEPAQDYINVTSHQLDDLHE